MSNSYTLQLDIYDFLQPNYIEQIERINHAIERNNSDIKIIYSNTESRPDFEYKTPQRNIVFDDLKDRAQKIARIFERIFYDDAIWIYVIEENCTGLNFELALCCDAIVAYKKDIQIGFPEINFEIFPFGIGSQKKILHNKILMNMALGRQLLDHQALLDQGIISFYIEANSWKIHLDNWVIKSKDNLAKTKINKKPQSSKINDIIFGRYRNRSQAQLQAEYLYRNNESTTEKILRLIKDAQIDSNIKTNLILEACLEKYISQEYHDWKKYLYSKGYSNSKNRNLDLKQYLNVALSVATVLPPINLITKLLAKSVLITFFSDESESLTRSLEIVSTKLAKNLSAHDYKDYWKNQIFWHQGRAPLDCITIEYMANDEILIEDSNDSIRMQLLSSSDDEPDSLICREGFVLEINDEINSQRSGNLENLLRRISGNYISSKCIGKDKMFSSVFARSYMFECLLWLGIQSQCTFEQILESLQRLKFNQMTTTIDWEKFLTNRHYVYGHSSENYSVSGLFLYQPTWELSNTKEAGSFINEHIKNSMAQPSKSNTTLQPDNNNSEHRSHHYWADTSTIGEYLCYALALVSRRFVKVGILESDFESDHVVSLACGCPSKWRSFQSKLYEFDEKRLAWQFSNNNFQAIFSSRPSF